MDSSRNQQVVPGIVLDAQGQATVDASLTDVLLDLAEQLEAPTRLPVDFEHVVAAIVLAAGQHQLDDTQSLVADDANLIEVLTPHVKTVFAVFGGQVGKES